MGESMPASGPIVNAVNDATRIHWSTLFTDENAAICRGGALDVYTVYDVSRWEQRTSVYGVYAVGWWIRPGQVGGRSSPRRLRRTTRKGCSSRQKVRVAAR